jgi:cell division GTPase FtsZ
MMILKTNIEYASWDDDDGLNAFFDGRHYAIIVTGIAAGENRVERALTQALETPCLKAVLPKVQKIWLTIDTSKEHALQAYELLHVGKILADTAAFVSRCADTDNSLGESVKVMVIAGFEKE